MGDYTGGIIKTLSNTYNINKNKESSNNKLKVIIYFLLFLLIVGSIVVFLYSNETRIVPIIDSFNVTEKEPYQESYQEAVYKNVETTTYENTTEYRPVYSGKLCNGGIDSEGNCKGNSWYYKNASNVSIEEVVGSFYETHTITLAWFDGSKPTKFTDIGEYTLDKKQIEYTISNPRIVQEQVIDGYETKYRTTYKDVTKQKTRVLNESVTKSRFEWYFNQS